MTSLGTLREQVLLWVYSSIIEMVRKKKTIVAGGVEIVAFQIQKTRLPEFGEAKWSRLLNSCR